MVGTLLGDSSGHPSHSRSAQVRLHRQRAGAAALRRGGRGAAEPRAAGAGVADAAGACWRDNQAQRGSGGSAMIATILLVVALVLFVLAAIGWNPVPKVNLIGAGLAFWVLA